MCGVGGVAFLVAFGDPLPVFAVGFAVGLEGVLIEAHPGDGLGFLGDACENEGVGVTRGDKAAIDARRGLIDSEEVGGVFDGGEAALGGWDVVLAEPIEDGDAALAGGDVAEGEERVAGFGLGLLRSRSSTKRPSS